MDEKIIELVARAICVTRGVDPDGDWRATPYPGGARLMLDFHDEQPQQWRQHAKEARAAIEAYEAALDEAGMVIVPEKPTEQMIRAAFDPYGRNIYADGETAWREMLDAMPNTTDRSELAQPSE